MEEYFKLQEGKYTGDNWMIAFGKDEDGKDYFITTNNIKASELSSVSKGAKNDAQLVVELLNRYYNGQIKVNF